MYNKTNFSLRFLYYVAMTLDKKIVVVVLLIIINITISITASSCLLAPGRASEHFSINTLSVKCPSSAK